MAKKQKHKHYFKSVKGLKKIDVYRVIQIFNALHPCQQHVIKKLLCTGQRGHKDTLHDIQDSIDSLKRWREMLKEDVKRGLANDEYAVKTPPEVKDAPSVMFVTGLDDEGRRGETCRFEVTGVEIKTGDAAEMVGGI